MAVETQKQRLIKSAGLPRVGVDIFLDDLRVSVVGFLRSGAESGVSDLDDAFAFLRRFVVGHEGEAERYIPFGEFPHLPYRVE